jgi:hypothetical protein
VHAGVGLRLILAEGRGRELARDGGADDKESSDVPALREQVLIKKNKPFTFKCL